MNASELTPGVEKRCGGRCGYKDIWLETGWEYK